MVEQFSNRLSLLPSSPLAQKGNDVTMDDTVQAFGLATLRVLQWWGYERFDICLWT